MLTQKLVFSCEKRHTNNWYKDLFWAPLSREKKMFVLIPLGAFWMVRPKAHCLLFEVCLTSDFHFQNSSKHSREKLRTFACINTQGNWHLKLLVGLSWCGQNLCVNFLWVLFPLPTYGKGGTSRKRRNMCRPGIGGRATRCAETRN